MFTSIIISIIITIIIEKGRQCKARRERLTPYISPETPQYQPIERQKIKRKQ